eukprot:238583_1
MADLYDDKDKYPSVPTDTLYILSPTNQWRECEVSQILDNFSKWKIHYMGLSTKYDEIVDCTSDRLTTQKPENVVPVPIEQKAKNKNTENTLNLKEPNETKQLITMKQIEIEMESMYIKSERTNEKEENKTKHELNDIYDQVLGDEDDNTLNLKQQKQANKSIYRCTKCNTYFMCKYPFHCQH